MDAVAIWFIWVHVNFILTPKICSWGFTIHKCLHSSHQRHRNVLFWNSWTEVLVFNSVFLAVSGNTTSFIGWDSCHVHESLLTYFSLVHTPHGGFILFEWKFHFFSLFFMFQCLFKFIQSYATNRRDFVTSISNVISSISTERNQSGKNHSFSEYFLKWHLFCLLLQKQCMTLLAYLSLFCFSPSNSL